MSKITCLPLDGLPKGIIAELARRLTRMLRTSVAIRSGIKTPDCAFDPIKRQFDSSRILSMLSNVTVESQDLVLGVTRNDLFLPYFTSVFGAASFRGRVAVVSGSRLLAKCGLWNVRNRIFYDRLAKESMHELGHAQGLDHCIDPYCVMHKSFCVSDIDEKTLSFCSSCRREFYETYKYIPGLSPIS